MNRKMRGMILLFCAACVLALPLFATACDRTEDPDLPSRAEVSSEGIYAPDREGFWDLNDLVRSEYVFQVEGLYGEPYESLAQTGQAIYSGRSWYTYLDTPVGILLYADGDTPVPFYYDKRTGRFSYMCNDPLCDHEPWSCIWGEVELFPHYGGDVMFFVICPAASWEESTGSADAPYRIYVSDLQGNDLRVLYENDGNMISFLIRAGEYLYFEEEGRDPETQENFRHLLRIPLTGGRAEAVLTDVGHGVLPLEDGESLLYVDGSDDNCYLCDVQTEKKTLLGNGMFPLAVYRGWVYYNAEGGVYRASTEDFSLRERVFGAEDKLLKYSFAGDRIYFLHTTAFSEHEFYGTYWKYDLYSAALDGSDRTLLMEFQTDGIPDRIEDMETDGKLLTIRYSTYLDHENEFNPGYATEWSNAPLHRYAMIDLSTGEWLHVAGKSEKYYR